MRDVYLLYVDQGPAGGILEALRHACQLGNSARPHITVRYAKPSSLIGIDDLYSGLYVQGIRLAEPGRFATSGRTAIFIRCDSPKLESVSYKPRFPDSVFHITLYEGADEDYAARLVSVLQEFPWRLGFDFDAPQQVIRKESQSNRGVLSQSGLHQLRLSDFSLGATEKEVDRLALGERLELARALCKRLHEILPATELTAPTAEPRELEYELPDDRQLSLWGSSQLRTVVLAVPATSLALENEVARSRDSGLYLTPPELAHDIVTYALRDAVAHDVRFGDPCIGSGIFFAQFYSSPMRPEKWTASAVELDLGRARLTSRRWADTGLSVHHGDFISAKPADKWTMLFGNPPYVRYSKIDHRLRERWASLIRADTGLKVGARSSLHVYFVLRADAWLADGGRATWLLPANLLDVNYGEVIQAYLTDRVRARRIHYYDSGALLFERAETASMVISYDKVAPKSNDVVTVSYGASLLKPETSKAVTIADLRRSHGWRRFLHSDSLRRDGLRLGDLFTVKRGVATGANSWFVLTEEAVAELGAPRDAVRPVLPRPRMLPSDGVIRQGVDGLLEVPMRQFLIDSNRSLTDIRAEAPAFGDYLARAAEAIGDRYLVRRRNPFYKQEDREPAPYLVSNMGKDRDGNAPVTYYLNLSTATALNNYILLYPRPFLSAVLASEATMRRLLCWLRGQGSLESRLVGRHYGGGMVKLEPRGLASLVLDTDWGSLREKLEAPG